MRIVFEEMSSWTALTIYPSDEDNILDQLYIKQLCLDFYLFKVLVVIEENAYLKKYSSIQKRAHKFRF